MEVGVSPELPESWSLLVADEAVRLAPGECDALPISISVPRDALSGTYEVPVVVSYTRFPGSVQSATAVFTVRINEVRKVKVSLVKAPEYVTDTAYTVSFLLTNQGNVIETLELVAREIQGAVVKPSPARVSVKPGAGAITDVHVKLQSVPGKVLDHTISITAESRDSQLARASASARVKVLPHKLSDSDAYHHLPVRIELSAATRAAASGAGLKITGEGPLAYGGKDRLRLSIADSSGAVEIPLTECACCGETPSSACLRSPNGASRGRGWVWRSTERRPGSRCMRMTAQARPGWVSRRRRRRPPTPRRRSSF